MSNVKINRVHLFIYKTTYFFLFFIYYYLLLINIISINNIYKYKRLRTRYLSYVNFMTNLFYNVN
jgi:hypothetical protein